MPEDLANRPPQAVLDRLQMALFEDAIPTHLAEEPEQGVRQLFVSMGEDASERPLLLQCTTTEDVVRALEGVAGDEVDAKEIPPMLRLFTVLHSGCRQKPRSRCRDCFFP